MASDRARRLVVRLALLVAVFALIGFLFVFGRRVGVGEWALVGSIFFVAFGVEAVRYVVRKFVRGYRGE